MINLTKKEEFENKGQRKRKHDNEREKKISECTRRLKTEKGFTVENFLDAMVNRNLFQYGKRKLSESKGSSANEKPKRKRTV